MYLRFSIETGAGKTTTIFGEGTTSGAIGTAIAATAVNVMAIAVTRMGCGILWRHSDWLPS